MKNSTITFSKTLYHFKMPLPPLSVIGGAEKYLPRRRMSGGTRQWWLLLLFMLIAGWCYVAAVPTLWAQPPVGETEGSKVGGPREGLAETKVEGELVSLSPARINAELREIQRKLKELESNQRFLEERIRHLDRTVDDLRRRR